MCSVSIPKRNRTDVTGGVVFVVPFPSRYAKIAKYCAGEVVLPAGVIFLDTVVLSARRFCNG